MTSPAKPPAPMEPIKPCPFCAGRAIKSDDGIYCEDCGVMLADSSTWNRRAAPSPTDGEVGELVNRIDGAYLQAVGDGDDALRDLLGDASDALSRQSAELAEAREKKREHDERCNRFFREAEAREQRMVNAEAELADIRKLLTTAREELAAKRLAFALYDQATAALTALGCKLGPEGWMRPCDPRTCRNCSRGYQGQMVRENCWLPIPGAGAKGDK